jgi:LytR cell envelope-related transcriptional attenuator
MSVGNQRSARPQIAFSLGRGIGLVAAFVVVGIVLLKIIGDAPSGFGGRSGGGGKAATLPSGATTTGVTTTTAKAGATKPPSQVHVLVLNAGAAGGAAGNKTNQLRAAGYATDPAGNSQPRRGTAVACRQGFENEAKVLASQVGQGTNVEPFPNPPPSGVTDQVNCVVFLGQ